MLELQDILALSLVAVAAVYILHRARATIFSKRDKGCGTSCSGCPSGLSDQAKGFVSLDTLERPKGE